MELPNAIFTAKVHRTGLASFLAQVVEKLAVIMGVKERRFRRWDPSADYAKDARAVGRDGTLYRAMRATGPSGNNVQDPITAADPYTVWTEEAMNAAPPVYRYNDADLRHAHAACEEERRGMRQAPNAGEEIILERLDPGA